MTERARLAALERLRRDVAEVATVFVEEPHGENPVELMIVEDAVDLAVLEMDGVFVKFDFGECVMFGVGVVEHRRNVVVDDQIGFLHFV